MRCIMRYKQFLAAASAAIFLLACASCGNDTKLTVDESSSVSSSGVSSGDTEPTVGEVIQPKEDSAEYDLGTYRLSSTGVKTADLSCTTRASNRASAERGAPAP